MTAYPAWTPASRPGIIPLHPLGFGTILGRSFAALRQNPRVLLGFALVVQTLAYAVVLAGVITVAWVSFTRLDTLRPGTEEFDTVFAGSIALTLITAFVLSLAAGALSVIVQGIVVVEVTHAAVAEKLPLGALWRQVKPILWRLIGYSLLLVLALTAVLVLVVTGVVAVAIAVGPVAILLTILLILAAIPFVWWLMIKLLLVPAAIIIEHATIGQALSRSWSLTRGRFWPALGIIVIISVTLAAVAQAVSIPFSFLSAGLTTIISPTGDPEPSATIGLLVTGLLTQVVTLLLQSVAVIVQSTATALIYIDCRMRREGLDLDLLAYVERRDAGATGLPDPYRENVGRIVAPRAAGAYGTAPYGAQPPYPAQPHHLAPLPYAQQPPYAGQPAYGAQPPYAGQPADTAQPTYPPQPSNPAPASAGAPPPETDDPDAATSVAPSPTAWTAPGAAPDADREAPWR